MHAHPSLINMDGYLLNNSWMENCTTLLKQQSRLDRQLKTMSKPPTLVWFSIIPSATWRHLQERLIVEITDP